MKMRIEVISFEIQICDLHTTHEPEFRPRRDEESTLKTNSFPY
jgi:hypothetical protein